MKIIIEDSNLVDKELDIKIRKKLKDKVQELDKSKKYTMDLEFCEDLIRCESEIDSYEIPEEALPPYQRRKRLKGEDKIYELLRYRIHTVENIVKEYGIKIKNCSIKGMPSMDYNKIELCFEEEEDTQIENSCKRKREKTMTVTTIMPSYSGFIENLSHAVRNIERKAEAELKNVFDDKKEYDKYKSLVNRCELYNILDDFKKEYGNEWMYSGEYKSELKEKFIKTIEIKAGIIRNDILKESILKPVELKTVLIYEIPVYKISKKNSAVHKSIGHIRLLTNGRIINVKFQPHSKLYAIPDEIFEECFINVNSDESNAKLIKMIENLTNKVDENSQKFGYKLEKDIFHNILVYIDVKNILKKAKEA